MTSYFAPICLGCAHYRGMLSNTDGEGTPVCAAFPHGIPLAIWHSGADHRQSYVGDQGVRFVAKDKAAADYAALLLGDDTRAATEADADPDSIKLFNYRHDSRGRFAVGDGLSHEHEGGGVHGQGAAQSAEHYHSGGSGGGGGGASSRAPTHEVFEGQGHVLLQPHNGSQALMVFRHLDDRYSINDGVNERRGLSEAEMRRALTNEYHVVPDKPIGFGGQKIQGAEEPTPGHLHLLVQSHHIDIQADGVGHYALRVEPDMQRYEAALHPVHMDEPRLNEQQMRDWLAAHHLEHAQALVDLAREDAARYAHPNAEMQRQIDATNARRDYLDRKYGPYSEAALAQHVRDTYEYLPALRDVLNEHYAGNNYANEAAVARRLSIIYGHPDAQRAAREGAQTLREISEWSLLHQPQTAPDGTIRLFHGVGMDMHPEDLVALVRVGTYREGMSWSSHFGSSRRFAEATEPYGQAHGVLTGRMHAGQVLFWHGMLPGNHRYLTEYEYILGHGAVPDVAVIPVGNFSPGQALHERGGIIWR